MFRVLTAVSSLALALGCSKVTPRPSPPQIACFDASTDTTSAGTRAVFEARHCQGGGVTWAPILRALVARRGRIKPASDHFPGFTGAEYALDTGARFAIDEEAEDAHFCTDSPDLLAALHADHDRVNADPSLLRSAMAEASAFDMECNETDGRE